MVSADSAPQLSLTTTIELPWTSRTRENDRESAIQSNASLNQIRLAGIPYTCQQALVRFVVMAMVRRRYDCAACRADISLVGQQAGVNFRVIGNVRAAKAEGIILTGDRLLL